MARSLSGIAFLLAIVGLFGSRGVLAQSPVPADEPTAVGSTLVDESPRAEQRLPIQQWMAQLDRPKFSDRQEARRRLSAAGAEAIPALENAATSDCSREVSASAMQLLERLYKSSMPDASAGAEKALQRIAAEQGNQHAAVASRILKGPDPTEYVQYSSFAQRNALRQMQNRGRGRMIQAGAQIQFGGGRLQIMRMNVQNAGGVRTIDVQDNGRKISIKEDANGAIEMNVTEKVNGQEQTQKFTAKNADELKQRHPEAEKLYQRYAKNGVIPGVPAVVPRQAQNAPEKK